MTLISGRLEVIWLAKANIKESADRKLSLSFSVLVDRESNYEYNHCLIPYRHLHFTVKLNVRKSYRSLEKAKGMDSKGVHKMPLSERKRRDQINLTLITPL